MESFEQVLWEADVEKLQAWRRRQQKKYRKAALRYISALEGETSNLKQKMEAYLSFWDNYYTQVEKQYAQEKSRFESNKTSKEESLEPSTH